jgi:hypothetical protein
MIVDHNGLQHLWTLFKFASFPIKISAGWAIRNCLASIEVCLNVILLINSILFLRIMVN